MESTIRWCLAVTTQTGRLTTIRSFGTALLAATRFIAGTAAASAANLVVNGSFETTSLPGKGTFAGSVASWSGAAKLTLLNYPGTVSTAYLDVYDGFPAVSPDGGNFAELDGHRGFGRDDEQR